MKRNLPLHPTKRHPLTGEPLRALWVRPDGRACWPIMGGAEDADDKGDTGDKGDDANKGAGTDKPGDKGDQGSADKGFPENTPVAEMTAQQQVAYYKHQSRKHEERATAYRTAAGGKTADEIKTELEAVETLRREKLSDQERAVEDAKREARESAAREYAPKAARTAFEFALSHLKDEDRTELIDTLDLTKVITDSGDIDTAKVRSIVEKIAPADKDKGNRHFDFGGGRRQDSGSAQGGVAQVMAERRAAREARK